MKHQIDFSPAAWNDLWTGVRHCSTEVGFHGFMTREQLADGMLRFEVTDVYVPPQYVTGAHWECREPEYSDWFVANVVRKGAARVRTHKFHFHSHVNMAPHPSASGEYGDMTVRERITSGFTQGNAGDYYAFMIGNKLGQFTLDIIDSGTMQRLDEHAFDVTVGGEHYLKTVNAIARNAKPMPVSQYFADDAGRYALDTKRTNALGDTQLMLDLDEDFDLDDFDEAVNKLTKTANARWKWRPGDSGFARYWDRKLHSYDADDF